MCDADSIICLIEALPMARSKRQPVIILVLLCLIGQWIGPNGLPLPTPRTRRLLLHNNAQDKNDNAPAILFWCYRLRLYSTCRRMG